MYSFWLLVSNNYYIYWVCICRLTCTACNTLAPYCHPSPLRLYIFSKFFSQTALFPKNILCISCVFWLSIGFLCKQLFIPRRRSEGDITNTYRSGCNVHVIFSVFKENWISSIDLRKIHKYGFKRKSVQLSRFVPCGRTDMTKLIAVFLNFSKAPNHYENLSGNR